MFRWIALPVIAGLMIAQEPSTFRVNTRLVEVDVVVRAKNSAVMGLTKKDFQILDNGKPQNIATFTIKSSKGRVTAAPLPSGVVSNRVRRTGEEPVAATVILLDRLNTEVQDQAYFGKELVKYLKTLESGEHVAIYVLLKNLRVVQDFTEDPQRLLQVLGKVDVQQSTALAGSNQAEIRQEASLLMKDQSMMSPEQAALMAELITNSATEMEDLEKRNRALLTSRSLEDIAQHLHGLPGRKKLIWVSGGFPIGVAEVDARAKYEFGTEVKQAVRALNNANVAVYAIDPRGLVASDARNFMAPGIPERDPDPRRPPEPVGLNAPNIASMNLFASATGGRAIYGTNDLQGSMKTVMEDDDVIYTLGFYPADQKTDGSYHSLSVKVARNGVEIHHRKGYLASDTKVSTPKQRRETVNDAVANPLDATELGLRATAVPLDGRPGRYQLELTLNIPELHLDHQKDRWIGTIDFGTHFSTTPKLRGTLETIRISLTEDRLREALNNGFVLRRELDSGGETGELRIVVQDRATGSIGSVRVPIGTE